MKNIGVYIHIPFCVKKCNYCDFNSGPYSAEIQQKYVDSLCKEMIAKSQFFSCYQVDTVFIGGGTPSIIDAQLIGKIFDTLNKYYRLTDNAEISIECNPGTCNEDKLKQYLSFGINRISFGLQSTDNDQLTLLGRIHRYEDFLKSYEDARSAGFSNINVDLMGAIPNQNLESFKDGLLKIKGLGPEHLSIYSLIIEEGTPFYNMNLNLADEDEEREMVHIIPSVLGDDYHQYEISNYAKKGYECKHNIKYWKRDEYVGFGVSAASLLSFDFTNSNANVSFTNEPCFRFKNISDVNDYISYDGDIIKINDEREYLEQSGIESEYIFLGLRMNEGILLPDYSKRFNKNIFDEYDNAVNKHIENRLLIRDGDRLYLSERGRDLSNYVFKDFV
ncbi:MAG: radical SAM family heme chaperone HemW [Lachnospiraceae bacterium]|nr:radical SAM family heme chaperone HemW [Lachnospiraceae bacterium]